MEVLPSLKTQVKSEWKILVIDDDEDDFLIARDMLREAKGRKINVYWASTYAAGRDELINNQFNAVLVDYDLGMHSGIELIREANELGYDTPLILFTGRGSYEVDVEAMEAGATMYLTKGEVNALLLERAIRYTIEIKQRENELREARETAERALTERKRAEEALHRIEARWNAAIESFDVGAIIAAEDEQVIYWNPAARQMHGFTRPDEGIEPLEETPITFQLWTPDGSHMLELDEWPMRRIKRGETVSNLELRIRRPDQGWEKVFSYSGTMIDTAGGERLIFLTCQNLTEKRRIEDALRESEARLRLALTTAHMVAWEYDPATLKVILSENAEEVLELPRRHENSDEGYNLLHPDDVERHRVLVTRAIATGGSYVSVYRHPHSEYVIWLEEHGQALVDRSGKTIRLVGVVQNITPRKVAEEALRQALAKAEEGQRTLEALMEYVPEGITIAEAPEATIRMVSRYGQEILGGAHDQMTAEQVVDEWKVYDRDGITPLPTEQLPLVRAVQGGEVVKNQDLVQVNSQGQHLYLSCSAGPIRDASGKITGGVVAWREISERKQAEKELQRYSQELERSNQALQDFAFVASHDLQEPLRKIIMFGNSLRRHRCDTPDEAFDDNLDRMLNAAERMQTLIAGLLDLSRINARGRVFKPVHLTQVVEEVVSDLELHIQAVKGQVTIGELPVIEADELQMRQLFQNLIGNAIKFHKPDVSPVVRVSGTVDQTKQPRMVEIHIQDNGIGFEQKYAEKIFQPFQRLHGKDVYEGTGLGLAICQKIIERHHGMIEVQSVPGEGTTFTVRLPFKSV